MRQIDRIAIEERGIPGLTLMERAGQAVANLIISRVFPRKVAVVTGKGNNAGDGFVAARLLSRAGFGVTLLMLADETEISGDALTNFRALPPEMPRVSCKELSQIPPWLYKVDCIVDAVLGTGIKGEIKGLYADVIRAINRSAARVVAVDIPSGLPGDAVYFDSLCVKADYTVTMGLPKLGMVQHPAAAFCGEVIVASIGFPEDLLQAPTSSRCNLLTSETVAPYLPFRPPDGHKGTFGTVLIVAGSPGMTGAASMTALAAARSGAGLVFVAMPEKLAPILEAKLTEPITMPLVTEEQGIPDLNMHEKIMQKSEGAKAVALGPGMGKAPQTRKLIRKLYADITAPLVLDADGLNAFENNCTGLKNRKAPTVLTPHPGELARLLNKKASEIRENRISVARDFATQYNVILALKGASTVVANPDGEIFINSSGNTALSKGGSGDVLTGLIAGFLAQGLHCMKAAGLGVFIHGMAGEIAGERKTVRAALPTDVIDAIPSVFKELEDISEKRGKRL